ncbi:hypothetical protein GCM10027417_27770 [Glutamicibacter endophyticus]
MHAQIIVGSFIAGDATAVHGDPMAFGYQAPPDFFDRRLESAIAGGDTSGADKRDAQRRGRVRTPTTLHVVSPKIKQLRRVFTVVPARRKTEGIPMPRTCQRAGPSVVALTLGLNPRSGTGSALLSLLVNYSLWLRSDPPPRTVNPGPDAPCEAKVTVA